MKRSDAIQLIESKFNINNVEADNFLKFFEEFMLPPISKTDYYIFGYPFWEEEDILPKGDMNELFPFS